MMKNLGLRGFTLAEVLIVIAVVGVVAALTIPTLISAIQPKADETRAGVIEAKLIKGLNLLNVDGGINNTYSSTEDFVKELSKHLKMNQICSADKISDCLTYNEIQVNNNEKKKLNRIKFNVNNSESEAKFEDVAGFVLADGTPMVVSYNKNCISEDKAYNSIHPCVAGFYDVNGTNNPNKYGSDIRIFGGLTIDSACLLEAGGLCFTSNAQPRSGYLQYSEAACLNVNKKYGLTFDCTIGGNQYRAAAIDYCGGPSKIMSQKQLAQLANLIYTKNGNPINLTPPNGIEEGLTLDTNSEIYKNIIGYIFGGLGMVGTREYWLGKGSDITFKPDQVYFGRMGYGVTDRYVICGIE